MVLKKMSLGLASAATAIVLLACSKDPQLNVQSAQSAQSPQSAPQNAPAESPTSAASELPSPTGQPMSATPAGELPAGHPAVALPPGHPPAGEMAGAAIELPPVDPNTGHGGAALVWDVPASWRTEPPANPMRRAQYRIPGAAGDAELVVFYLGPNQGGPPLDNAQRWAMQFVQPDGSDPLAALKTRTGDIHGIPALFVETAGTYNSGTMSSGPSVAKENWALLGVVAEGGDANWFFKLTGPMKTVAAERGAFEGMIASLRRGS